MEIKQESEKDMECHLPPEARITRVSPLPVHPTDTSLSCDEAEVEEIRDNKRSRTSSPITKDTHESSINKRSSDRDSRRHLTPSPKRHRIHHPLALPANHSTTHNLGLLHSNNNHHLLQQVVSAPVPAIMAPRPSAPARASFMISDILGDHQTNHREKCFPPTKYDVTDSEGDSDCDQYENEVDVVGCNNGGHADDYHRGKLVGYMFVFVDTVVNCLEFLTADISSK